jgi:hypothetical protein
MNRETGGTPGANVTIGSINAMAIFRRLRSGCRFRAQFSGLGEHPPLDENELGETGPSLPKAIDRGFMLFEIRERRAHVDRQISSNVFSQPGVVHSRWIDCHDDCGCVPPSILAWKPTVSPIWGTSCGVTWRCNLQRQLDLHSRPHEVALEDRMTAPLKCDLMMHEAAGMHMPAPNDSECGNL